MLEFEGKSVVVAGGTRGLGRAIAETFARAGGRVATCGRNESEARSLTDEATSKDLDISAIAVDLTNHDELASWLTGCIDRLDHVNVFVASAGASARGDDWRGSLEAALLYVVAACDLLNDSLCSSKGNVVVLGSVTAQFTDGGSDVAAYGAAKAALTHYVSQKAQEWGPWGVRINSVVPGPVMVPGGAWDPQSDTPSPADLATITESTALGRLVSADEVANAVSFLASPRASGITGSHLRVDAGFLKSV